MDNVQNERCEKARVCARGLFCMVLSCPKNRYPITLSAKPLWLCVKGGRKRDVCISCGIKDNHEIVVGGVGREVADSYRLGRAVYAVK